MTLPDLVRSYDDALDTDSSASRFTVGDWGSLLSATLPVTDLAAGSVATFAAAVDRFKAAHRLSTRPWHLVPERIAASFAGDKMLRIDGNPVRGFAELSGFFASADGWVRTHANYPHHRRALIAALELPADAEVETVLGRLHELPGGEIERRCASASAVAVRVRTEAEWAHEHGAVTDHQLVEQSVGARSSGPRPEAEAQATDGAPLNGIRVLDLTRVIAGPVAGRALALLGADVLRIDPARLPEIEWQHLENGQGKRSTLLDLRNTVEEGKFRTLLSQADVVLSGYRPGSLERVGVDSLPSGIVHGRVSAWGAGSWSGRRGFDSIVQAATGISVLEGTAGAPGALPAQALDHASGYLLAAATVDALTSRRTGGPDLDVSVSLARTAAWLLGRGGRVEHPPASTLPASTTTTVLHGAVLAARPALAEFADYPAPARRWGADEPAFRVVRMSARGASRLP
ncbi:CoA transferase [Rhodococcoides kyotonense]|uniref:CoA-transferase family III n=1 Tax=Rhodococcoides kyotonense TaxID=398843 RepID=A0A239CLR3_9NOCA|nr:CoA transferase [Rhodococcus kyotonensis]SNS21186.1 CoA-transferase family III [Rhodococcus kyotonensis]